MTNESKVVRYTPEVVHKIIDTGISYGVAKMREREQGTYVTHADYRALEEELAALRGKCDELFHADKAFDALYHIRYAFISREASRRQAALDELDDSLL